MNRVWISTKVITSLFILLVLRSDIFYTIGHFRLAEALCKQGNTILLQSQDSLKEISKFEETQQKVGEVEYASKLLEEVTMRCSNLRSH